MGYRSQVVLAVSKEAYPYFLSMLVRNPKSKRLCDNADVSKSTEEGWILMWDSIKWYHGYGDITPIADFIDAMDGDDLEDYGDPSPDKQIWSEHFKYVRVGEDFDDIKVKGMGFWDIHPATRVEGI